MSRVHKHTRMHTHAHTLSHTYTHRYDSAKAVTLDRDYVAELDLVESQALDDMIMQCVQGPFCGIPDSVWELDALADLRLQRSGIETFKYAAERTRVPSIPAVAASQMVTGSSRLGVFTMLEEQARCFEGAIAIGIPNMVGIMEQEKTERLQVENDMFEPPVMHMRPASDTCPKQSVWERYAKAQQEVTQHGAAVRRMDMLQDLPNAREQLRSRGGWGGRGEAPDHLLREIRALDDRQELIRQKEERLEAEKREREKRGKHARFAHDPAKLEGERERYAAAACTLRAVRPTKWICM